MFINAVYKDTGKKCYVNTDYVIDIFEQKDGLEAYTFDNDRGAYLISRSDLGRFLRAENEDNKVSS